VSKTDYDRLEETVECGIFYKCLGSIITSNTRRTRKIKYRIYMANVAFKRKKTLFITKLDLNLRKKLMKCYIWSIKLYGAETWTLRKVDQK
jgi:hypothetical protein